MKEANAQSYWYFVISKPLLIYLQYSLHSPHLGFEYTWMPSNKKKIWDSDRSAWLLDWKRSMTSRADSVGARAEVKWWWNVFELIVRLNDHNRMKANNMYYKNVNYQIIWEYKEI